MEFKVIFDIEGGVDLNEILKDVEDWKKRGLYILCKKHGTVFLTLEEFIGALRNLKIKEVYISIDYRKGR